MRPASSVISTAASSQSPVREAYEHSLFVLSLFVFLPWLSSVTIPSCSCVSPAPGRNDDVGEVIEIFDGPNYAAAGAQADVLQRSRTALVRTCTWLYVETLHNILHFIMSWRSRIMMYSGEAKRQPSLGEVWFRYFEAAWSQLLKLRPATDEMTSLSSEQHSYNNVCLGEERNDVSVHPNCWCRRHSDRVSDTLATESKDIIRSPSRSLHHNCPAALASTKKGTDCLSHSRCQNSPSSWTSAHLDSYNGCLACSLALERVQTV